MLALISSVEEFFEDFYDGTKKKKAIWNAVAEHMREKGHYCSGTDCDKKWRNLKVGMQRMKWQLLILLLLLLLLVLLLLLLPTIPVCLVNELIR